MALSVQEKLVRIEESDMSVAFDGCHKLYLCENEEQRRDAVDTGYDLFPAKDIRSLINRSCGLVFVNNWALTGGSWTSDITIEQGEMPESWYGESAVDV